MLRRGVLSRPVFRPRFLQGDEAGRRLWAALAGTGVLGWVENRQWNGPERARRREAA